MLLLLLKIRTFGPVVGSSTLLSNWIIQACGEVPVFPAGLSTT